MPPADARTRVGRVSRPLVYTLIGLGLVAVIVIGLLQSKGGVAPNPNKIESKAPSAAVVRKAFQGSPAPLATLHREADRLIPGGRSELERQLAKLRGHPVVVNLWGSWCGPCRIEFPSFQQQAVRFGARVAFLGVNAKDNHGDAVRYLRKFPVTYPSVEDPDESVAHKLHTLGYPTTVYYDRSGKKVFVHQGVYADEKDLVDDIRRYTSA
jgi:cytochrome c biogenesis protein CcmG, thiol:disulfide interchange protein DsbE